MLPLALPFVFLGALAGVQAVPQQPESLSTSASTSQSTSSNSPSVCNNSPDLCDKKYNEVSYLGAHNAAFLRDDSTDDSISGNQLLNATVALDAGLRLLQAQTHNAGGSLRLCHSDCKLLDAGLLEDWLAGIEAWMAKNENEVVTILLANPVGDRADVSAFTSAFEKSGLDARGFSLSTGKKPTSEWPTLGSMISSGKRLVTFVTGINSTDYLLNEFSYVFETPFENRDLTDFNCVADRPPKADPPSNAVQNGYLSLVNHFKYDNVFGDFDVPDIDNITTTNDPGTSKTGSIGKHLEQCQSEWNKAPNFVLIDFWSQGEPLKAVDRLNGVTNASGRDEKAAKQVVLDDDSAAGRSLHDLGRAALLAFIASAMFMA